MIPPIPSLPDYGISPDKGFLPPETPLQHLPDPYYEKWEAVVANLQALLLSQRLRATVKSLPVLSTANLRTENEWRRAYVLLGFMLHGYIWGGDAPAEIIPPSISIPLLRISLHLELPPVATYSTVVLWNHKPIFPDEPADTLDNLASISTFTGSLDEQWFYLVSVAIEARGAPTLPLMLKAIAAARRGNTPLVIECLHAFAERLDELGTLLQRMYENCDPHVFYHRIRPFLAGSKNMAEAGLPHGVLYDDDTPTQSHRHYHGGSAAQSSLIQFFDIVLGIEHRPTGEKPTHHHHPNHTSSSSGDDEATSSLGQAPKKRHNFLMEMRSYMPGPHRRFLEHVANVANIREFVDERRADRALSIAYDSCLAMLRALRDKHIQMVSRYIIIKSRESRGHTRSVSPRAAPGSTRPVNIARPLHAPNTGASSSGSVKGMGIKPGSTKLRGTGGTALIPFLKQARDETGEPAIDAWAKRLLSNGPADSGIAALGKLDEHADGKVEVVGLAGTWAMDESEGGLCHW
ncbi:hypothetical protein FQN52_007720 [Onygenales sp. PD_12]|nr:hypothetical protein FQN52_007720 [Onygenales sp. PD_12]